MTPRQQWLAIRIVLLGVFVASVTTMFLVRRTTDTAVIEDGRYFLAYKSQRTEVPQEVYEGARWRGLVSGTATVAMMISLFALIGVESLRFRSRLSRGSRSV